jgi:hypothetical protein
VYDEYMGSNMNQSIYIKMNSTEINLPMRRLRCMEKVRRSYINIKSIMFKRVTGIVLALFTDYRRRKCFYLYCYWGVLLLLGVLLLIRTYVHLVQESFPVLIQKRD